MAEFKSDIQIAQEAEMQVINNIADKAGIPDKYVENYGKYKAKVDYRYLQNELKDAPDANLILVTAINPTPAGEGKTTTTIGLGDALNKLGKKTMIALREPSLGPGFGVKGGAAGGGYAQVVPMEDINSSETSLTALADTATVLHVRTVSTLLLLPRLWLSSAFQKTLSTLKKDFQKLLLHTTERTSL